MLALKSIMFKRWMVVVATIFLIFPFLPAAWQTAHAGANVWTSRGPEGGVVHGLAIDPSNPSIVYAGACGGVFRTTDQGTQWNLASALGGRCFTALALDPRTPTTIYGGVLNAGVFKSSDSGATWIELDTGLSTAQTIQALAIDPLTPSTVYAGTAGGVFKSTDGGANWIASNNGLTNLSVATLAVDPFQPERLYAGTTGAGVFRSIDGGATWVATGAASGNITAFAVNPRNPLTLYAARGNVGISSLFRSFNAGTTWFPVGPAFTAIRALTIDPLFPTTIYALADEGAVTRVFRSMDEGETWGIVDAGLPPITKNALAIDPRDNRIIYVATFGKGLFRTLDAGARWSAANTGFIATNVDALAAPNSIYAGTSFSGLFKSVDVGASWSELTNGITEPSIEALATDPLAPLTIYAGTTRGVFKSTDGGVSWSMGNTVLSFAALAVNPANPTTLYGGTTTGVFKSTDGGVNWSRDPLSGFPGAQVVALAIGPVVPETIYASTAGAAAFKSTDGGATWSNANIGGVEDFAIDPSNTNIVYAATSSGVFKSTDGAGTWSAAGTLPLTVLGLAIDPLTPTTVYAATTQGVFKSNNAAGTWTALTNNGLPHLLIKTIAIDQSNRRILHVSVLNGGVYSLEQPPPGTTEPGSGVVVAPVDQTTGTAPVIITFSQVTGGGTTTVTTSPNGSPPPTGLKLGTPPTYYEISTTATVTGPITICINYSGISFGNEQNLKLMHQEDTNGDGVADSWVNRTTSLDTVNNVICATVTSLSPFAVFEPDPYRFTGFFSPANNPPTVNTVKAGAAVPVKFSLGGNKGLDIFKPGYPVSRAVACNTSVGTDEIEQTVTAGQSELQYSVSTDQYTYVWKTSTNWKSTCRQFDLGLKDDSIHVLNFGFPAK